MPLSFAQNTQFDFCAPQVIQNNENQLKHIYEQPLPSPMTQRIHHFTQLFLDRPYRLTALGEGSSGEFDQAPLYRFDAFDCQTYVETILALTLSPNAQQFKHCIRQIRYRKDQVDFILRNHFLTPDWTKNLQQKSILEDITKKIVNDHQHEIALEAKTTIDPAQWYQHFNIDKIRLCHASAKTLQQKLKLLKQRGQDLLTEKDTLAYLPLDTLILPNGEANQTVFNQIPNDVVIIIVRPNWDLTKQIGTHLNISHLGIAFRENDVLYFYQASSISGKVVKTPLIDYLRSLKSIATIKGINIQKILPAKICQ